MVAQVDRHVAISFLVSEASRESCVYLLHRGPSKTNRPNRNMAQLCVQHTNIKRIVNMDWDTHYDAVIESSVWLHNDPPQREQEIA